MNNLIKAMLILFLGLSGILPSYGQDTDSIPQEYTGYRVYVQTAKVLKDKKKKFKIALRLVNTGSQALDNSTKEEYPERLIYVEDGAIEAAGKYIHADLIMEKLRKFKRYRMKSGQAQELELNIKIPKERQDGGGGFLVNTHSDKGPDYTRHLCPDLIVDSLVLVKREFKYAVVEFQVKNVGKGAINIIGDKRNKKDNVAVAAYFSGTKKFSRGAILAESRYLEGLESTKGVLFPGQTITMRMKVKRKKQSRYTKVLIIKVDSDGIVMECEEDNNYQGIIIR